MRKELLEGLSEEQIAKKGPAKAKKRFCNSLKRKALSSAKSNSKLFPVVDATIRNAPSARANALWS